METAILDKKDARRRDLIEATVRAIAANGYASTTLANVAAEAGLSRGIVNFYFTSKDELLLETMQYLADEYAGICRDALDGVGTDPAERILAIIDAELDARLWNLDRIGTWVAFLAESSGRAAYRTIGEASEQEISEELNAQIGALVARCGASADARRIARTLSAMQQGFWYDLLFYGESYDRAFVRSALIDYLNAVLPGCFDDVGSGPVPQVDVPAPAKPARTAVGATRTLPAWTYGSDAFFKLEMEHVFETSWQIICHVSDLANTGDYVTLDLANRRLFALRDKKGAVRVFHNVCRHRAARLCPGKEGSHRFNIVCPYHGWSFSFDGTLRAMSQAEGFPELDKGKFGLWPVETEIWNGFVFARMRNDGGPGVADLMAHYAPELEPYRFAELQPVETWNWEEEVRDVDWKNMMDNYLEGYHINPGHPGLHRMFGQNYWVESNEHATGRAFSTMVEEPSENWSEGAYMRLLPRFDHLPEDRQRAWAYYSLFPNMAFDVYPDQITFFHVVPTGAGSCRLRGRAYGLPDDRRETRACRWLNGRINNQVQAEDNMLIDWVQGGLNSGAYTTGYFSEAEVCLARFHDNVRKRLPVASVETAPAEHDVAQTNERLARRHAAAAQ